jgi:hypothetical protein
MTPLAERDMRGIVNANLPLTSTREQVGLMDRSGEVSRSCLSSHFMGIVTSQFWKICTAPTKNIDLLEIDKIICKQLPVQTELAAKLLLRSGSIIMEVAGFLELWIPSHQTARRHIVQDSNHNTRCVT